MFSGTKTTKPIEPKDSRHDQKYDYFLILDFQATCDSGKQPKPQEIIEFPCLKLNAGTLQVESVFHQYVLPTENPKLTDFCTVFTGITQEKIAQQPSFPEAMEKFDRWMREEGLISYNSSSPQKKFIFVTCGDWDLQTMLAVQCKFLDLPVPWYFSEWINVKRPFSEVMGQTGKGMMPMLILLNIKHTGRHHSGIDGCKNLANVVRVLISQKGVIFDPETHKTSL